MDGEPDLRLKLTLIDPDITGLCLRGRRTLLIRLMDVEAVNMLANNKYYLYLAEEGFWYICYSYVLTFCVCVCM